MKSWSGVKKILEQDRLAPSLRGRVSYQATRYHDAHDDQGRIALLIDGQEVFSAHPWRYTGLSWPAFRAQDPEASYMESAEKYWNRELEKGCGDVGSFYRAFREYDTQSIEQSLESDDPLVRTLAIVDRRVGKRRLEAMRESGFAPEPEWVWRFYQVRMEAEGLTP